MHEYVNSANIISLIPRTNEKCYFIFFVPYFDDIKMGYFSPLSCFNGTENGVLFSFFGIDAALFFQYHILAKER